MKRRHLASLAASATFLTTIGISIAITPVVVELLTCFDRKADCMSLLAFRVFFALPIAIPLALSIAIILGYVVFRNVDDDPSSVLSDATLSGGMSAATLRTLLNRENVDPEAYSLDGGLPDEKYVLAHDGRQWSVYYSERGLRSGVATYEAEGEACADLLRRLRASRPPWQR